MSLFVSIFCHVSHNWHCPPSRLIGEEGSARIMLLTWDWDSLGTCAYLHWGSNSEATCWRLNKKSLYNHPTYPSSFSFVFPLANSHWNCFFSSLSITSFSYMFYHLKCTYKKYKRNKRCRWSYSDRAVRVICIEIISLSSLFIELSWRFSYMCLFVAQINFILVSSLLTIFCVSAVCWWWYMQLQKVMERHHHNKLLNGFYLLLIGLSVFGLAIQYCFLL